MTEIMQWTDFITKGFLRLSFGIFLVLAGLSLFRTASRPLQDPIIIQPNQFNTHENEIITKLDSISKLPVDQQRDLFQKLSQEYREKYLR